jgi:hypothetical protein
MPNIEEDINMEGLLGTEDMDSSDEELVVEFLHHAALEIGESPRSMTEIPSTAPNTMLDAVVEMTHTVDSIRDTADLIRDSVVEMNRAGNAIRNVLTRIGEAIGTLSLELGDDDTDTPDTSVYTLEHLCGHFTCVKRFFDGFEFDRPPPSQAMDCPVVPGEDYYIQSATQCRSCISNLRTWEGGHEDHVPHFFKSQKEALEFAKPLLDCISKINDDLEEHSLDYDNTRKQSVVPASESLFLKMAFEALLISGKERVCQLQASQRDNSSEDASLESTPNVTIFGVNPDAFNLPKPTRPVAEEFVDRIYQSIQLLEVSDAASECHTSAAAARRNYEEPRRLLHPVPEGQERECSICRSEDKTEEYVQLGCKAKHVFGNDCLTVWLQENNSCPYCRETFDRGLYEWPEKEKVCPKWLRVLKGVRT